MIVTHTIYYQLQADGDSYDGGLSLVAEDVAQISDGAAKQIVEDYLVHGKEEDENYLVASADGALGLSSLSGATSINVAHVGITVKEEVVKALARRVEIFEEAQDWMRAADLERLREEDAADAYASFRIIRDGFYEDAPDDLPSLVTEMEAALTSLTQGAAAAALYANKGRVDTDDLAPSQTLMDAIEENITRADAVLCLLGAAGIAPPGETADEVAVAKQEFEKINPADIQGGELPALLNSSANLLVEVQRQAVTVAADHFDTRFEEVLSDLGFSVNLELADQEEEELTPDQEEIQHELRRCQSQRENAGETDVEEMVQAVRDLATLARQADSKVQVAVDTGPEVEEARQKLEEHLAALAELANSDTEQLGEEYDEVQQAMDEAGSEETKRSRRRALLDKVRELTPVIKEKVAEAFRADRASRITDFRDALARKLEQVASQVRAGSEESPELSDREIELQEGVTQAETALDQLPEADPEQADHLLAGVESMAAGKELEDTDVS